MSEIQDFDYWRIRRLWSLREAAYLLNGKEPLSEDEFKETDWCKSTTVGRTYDLIKEATLEGGELWSTDVGGLLVRRRIRATDAISWAIRRGITVPPELVGLARAQSGGTQKLDASMGAMDAQHEPVCDVKLRFEEWVALARDEAIKYILSHDDKQWTAGNLLQVGEHISSDWNKRNVCGPKGTPRGATIKRHALGGVLVEAEQRRATRGKRGK